MKKQIFTRILAMTLVCLLALSSGPVSMITFAETELVTNNDPVSVEFKNSSRTDAILVTIDGVETPYTSASGTVVSIPFGKTVTVTISDGSGGTTFGSVKYRMGPGGQTEATTPFVFVAGSNEFGGVITEVTSWKEEVINTPASAEDDTAITDEDTPVTIDVLDNDVDLEDDAFEIISNTSPSKGDLSIVNGEFVYTPNLNENGLDSFEYTITGGATALVSITINAVDDPSVAVDDIASTAFNTPVTIDVLDNDEDAEGNFEIISVVDPTNGSISYSVDGYLYTPNTDYVGTDTFTYTLLGGSSASVTVEVAEPVVVLPPTPVENFWITVDDYHTVYFNGQLLTNPDNTWTSVDSHIVNILDENIIAVKGEDRASGTATISGFIAKLANSDITDASWYYTLNEPTIHNGKEWYEAGYEGGIWLPVSTIPTTDYDQYWKNKISDYDKLSDATWIWSDDHKGSQFDSPVWFRNIINMVDLPTAEDDYLIIAENTQGIIPVVDNDIDPYGDGLTITSVSQSDNGQVQIIGNEIQFVPVENFYGQTSFTYTVSDGINRSVSASVYVTVSPSIYTSFETGTSNSYSVDLMNTYNRMVLLAQMQTANTTLASNLRNNILGSSFSVSDLRNDIFGTTNNSFTTKVETHDKSTSSSETIGYMVFENGLLKVDNQVIAEANTEIFDLYDDQGENKNVAPEWHTITLSHSFTNPVVIAELASRTGGDTTHIRIKDVTSNSFKLFFEEWDEYKQTKHHNHELVSYVVFEAGTYELLNGDYLEVENISNNSIFNDFSQHTFAENFDGSQVVFSQTQTYNDDNQVWMRQADIQENTVKLFGQTDNGTHGSETIGVVAIGPINHRPVITITGDQPQTIYLNDINYSDPGATAIDAEDGDLTGNIAVISDVDVNAVGTYTVKYNVSDTKGLAAEEKTRTVNVIKEALVITAELEANPNSVVDGNTAVVTVTLTDQYGDPVIGETVVILDDGLAENATDNNDGTYSIVALPSYGEDNEMTATVDGNLIADKDYVAVTKAATIVSSTLIADPDVVNEGETSTVTITLKDQYGDNLTGRVVEVFVDTQSIGNASETSAGVYEITFTPGLNEDNIITATQNTVTIPETDQVTVIEKDKYLVTFDSNGGSDVANVEVKEDDPVAEPTEPTKENAKFLGWFLNDTVYNFSTPVTDHIELIAKWQTVEIKDAEDLETENVELHIGYNRTSEEGQEDLSAVLTPQGTFKNITWEIVDGDNHIDLDQNGLVVGQTSTGNEPSLVKVTVTLDDDTVLTDTIYVTVINYTAPVTPPVNTPVTPPAATVSIALDTDYVELEYGTEALEEFFSYDFTETITGSSDNDVTWSVENDAIVSIDQNGVVEALQEGDTIITVTHNASGETASAEVVVFLVGDEENPLGAVAFYEPYVFGYPDTTFRPKNSVTRAEVATMFAKILNLNLNFPGSQKFEDVTEDAWYFTYVQAIARTDLFVGDTSGNFRPNEAITRAEMATVFAKYWAYLNINVNDAPADVTDVDSSHWASSYIYMMYNAGIVAGYPDGSYKPNDATLREQVVGMINTLIARPKFYPDYTKYLDIDAEHWAYGDIEAATTKYNVVSDSFGDEE